MKKNKVIIIALTVISSLLACNKKEEEIMPTNLGFYDSLYQSVYTNPFEEKEYSTNKAIYGYLLNDKQGYNSWYYLVNDGQEKEMTFDKKWISNNSYIDQDVCHSSNNVQVIRRFISDINGQVTIYGNPKCLNKSSKGGRITIKINNQPIFETKVQDYDDIGEYIEIKPDINLNDQIDFIVQGEDCDISFSPVISKDNTQDDSLYHLNDFGKQYGDVFPWYNEEEHTLYMWYLWSDDCNKEYNHCIDLSTNLIKMKSYPEANNFDLYNKYRHQYRYNEVFNVNNFIDLNNYSVGVRDNMLYKDEENQRYILIAGCYSAFNYPIWKSDLNIYVSDDINALSWTKAKNTIRSYDGHLPECPSLLKIGERWYPFVSESHYTKHQIGGLQYWVGDENVDCIDMDYSSLNTYWLDGEDLCAARPTQIGDKTYMWGWITASYNAVPLSPWAGYLNLPREIVQRKDGTLGGRMDPGLVKYINYGNLSFTNKIESSSNEPQLVAPEAHTRTFVTFDVDMQTSNNVSYMFLQGNNRYTCNIEKENDKTYMRIRSLDEPTHPLNSQLEIYNPSADSKYNVKIVNDGGIIEFFVNEDNALSAMTNMSKEPYHAYVCSDNESTFRNVSINQLRSYSDCD